MTSTAAVVVSFNTRELLRSCLAAVTREPAAEIVVVDNRSSDGSREMVRREFPSVTLVANTRNVGYGEAANRGLASCRAPYVLLLNADTRPGPGSLEALSCFLDRHPDAAAVGPRLLNADGTLQPSCLPFPGSLRLCLEKTILGRWRYRAHDRPRSVPWIVGAAMALRREAIDSVGGFDPAFFMYAEEVDLCFRLRKRGWRVHFTPDASVTHVGGASTEPLRAAMAVRRVRSVRLFYRRHYPRLQCAALDAAIRSTMACRWLRDVARRSMSRDPATRSRLTEDIGVWLDLLVDGRAEGEPSES